MRKQLYIDIVEKLKTINNAELTQLFKHFDLWNQNVEFIQEETPFEFPACFIEFLPIAWETIGGRIQQATINIRLHIVTAWYISTADNNPLHEQSLEYLDIPDRVMKALQSEAVPQTNGWMRVSSVINHNHGTIIDSVEEYKTHVTDYSTQESQSLLNNVEPVIN